MLKGSDSSTPHSGASDGRCGLRRHHDRGLRAGGTRRQGGGEAVSADNVAGLVVAAALLGYLVLALLFPERF
nr:MULTISPECIES: K(+)-transporting ATPase subunit F [unclassified Streptomyces]